MGPNLGPVSTFTTQAIKAGICNTGIRFTSTSPDAKSYIWDYGDGSSSTQSTNPVSFHSYFYTGNYTVTLIAFNAQGCPTHSIPQLITVTDAGFPSPATYFTAIDSVQCLSKQSFNFINQTTLNGQGWVVKYIWYLGDGKVDSANTYIYGKKYDYIGIYNVVLNAVSNLGCSYSYSMKVRVVADSLCNPVSTADLMGDFSANVNLFPNPNNGIFNLEITNMNLHSADMAVYDLLGRIVYSSKLNFGGKNTIEITDLNLSSGKYYMVLTNGQGKLAHKSFAVVK